MRINKSDFTWPPCKAWTSRDPINGFRHFVAINYGGKEKFRWVHMVSVLNGEIRFNILWQEMLNSRKWTIGWLRVPKTDSIALPSKRSNNKFLKNSSSRICLHPSLDSGLIIPLESTNYRGWF